MQNKPTPLFDIESVKVLINQVRHCPGMAWKPLTEGSPDVWTMLKPSIIIARNI